MKFSLKKYSSNHKMRSLQFFLKLKTEQNQFKRAHSVCWQKRTEKNEQNDTIKYILKCVPQKVRKKTKNYMAGH